jgi:NitT/TauT family transport system permease protein
MSDSLSIAASPQGTRGLARRVGSRTAGLLLPAAILGALVAAWELAIRLFDVHEYLLPAPHQIASTWFSNAHVFLDLGVNTAKSAIVGGLIGAVVAIVAAALVAPIPWLAQPLLAYAAMLQATPLIVLAPLAQVWFGDGTTAKVCVVAVAAFPLMFLATVRGLTGTPRSLDRLMISLAASRSQTFFKLRLHAALPSVLSGAKVVLTSSMIVAIVAELFGGPLDTLGTYMRQEALFFHSRNVWAAAVTAVLFGLGLYLMAAGAERILLRNRPLSE